MSMDFKNRRKPDRLQWLLVWLMGMVATGTGYQIIQNQANAVTRSKVETLVERDKSRVEQWQIDFINSQLQVISDQQREVVKQIRNKKAGVAH
jgi:hypothetical protein